MNDNLFVPPKEASALENFFATVGHVYADGVSLIIDGTETQKHYLVNTSGTYTAGTKVKVLKISGTYIVEYPVGVPKK